MMKFLLANAMFLLAPFLYLAAEKFSRGWSGITRGLMLAVTALVIFHLVPESVEVAGVAAVGAFLFGLMIPAIIERLKRGSDRHVHGISTGLAVLGLGIHAFFDGAGLAVGHDHNHGALPMAVLLHRLPVGVVIWGNLVPVLGTFKTWGVLIGMIALTSVGYFMMGSLFHVHDDIVGVALLQAFIAGTLLHVVFHRHHNGGHSHAHHGHGHTHSHTHGH